MLFLDSDILVFGGLEELVSLTLLYHNRMRLKFEDVLDTVIVRNLFGAN